MKKYDKYKPSGVEWIGDIPEHWEVKKLKYWIDSIVGGGTPSTNNQAYWNGNIPWVSPKDMKVDFIVRTEDYITELAIEESVTTIIPPGRVLIVVRSGILKHTLPVAINKVEVSLNQDMKAFEPKPKLKPEFLLWKLKGQSSDILTTCNKSGATVDSIEMEDFLSFPFVLPPPSEQIAIANYLDEKTEQINKLIANKQRLIELFKEERTAIINQAVTRGINPDVKYKPSGIAWLGDIPEHWEVKKLKYILQIKSGDGIKSSDISSEGTFPIYGGNGVMGFTEYFNSNKSDVIIGRVGAKCGNVRLVKGEKWISDNALVASVSNRYSIEYIVMLLEAVNLNALSNQNAQPLITGTLIKEKSTAIPASIDEQKQIVQFIETETNKIDSTIAKIEKEIELMREYRTALISEVVTGKIKVV